MLRCVEGRRVSDVSEYFVVFSPKLKQSKMITYVFLNCLNFLRVEKLRSLEMSVNLYPKTQRDVSEDCQNLKSHNELLSHIRLSVSD